MRLLRNLLLAIALVVAPLAAPNAPALAQSTPMNNQLVTCAQLVNAVSAGVFVWSSGAHTCTLSNLIINRTTFVAWISNNGDCAGGIDPSTYDMTYGDMIACKAGGMTTEQMSPVVATGSTSYSNPGTGACKETPAQTVFSTGSAVAPTSSSLEIKYQGTGSSQSYTATLRNPISQTVGSFTGSGTTVVITYYSSSAVAGVYTLTITGLTNSVCPSIGGGGTANGVLSWYQ